jgi:hypothetical protein
MTLAPMQKTFFEKHWTELTIDELANAQVVYHQALVRFFKVMGENPFTPENHRRLEQISSRCAALCREHAARRERPRVVRRRAPNGGDRCAVRR